MDLESKARAIAEYYHCRINQVRKYTGEPYINHPVAVAELVRSVPHTEEMIAAALLHDVLEDTECDYEELSKYFSYEVCEKVRFLTDISKHSDGNRAVRKAIDREHTRSAPPDVKTIKLADLIDNSRSIVERDPEFAKVYIAEKELLLEVLKEGDTTLWDIANGIVQTFKELK